MRPALSLLLVFLLTSCRSQTENKEFVVFAASSLTDAFTELATAYEDEHSDTDIVLNFAGSAQLAAQILEGAPADVFASANEQQIALVEEAGLVDGRTQVFAKNRLVLVTPADNPANIDEIADLARSETQFVTAVRGVPIREYTELLLTEYPEYDAIIDNIASEETNVRQVVLKITLGEADAAVVYATDVTPDVASQLNVVPLNAPITPEYFISSLDDHEFVAFVLSDEGQAILQKWGFDAP